MEALGGASDIAAGRCERPSENAQLDLVQATPAHHRASTDRALAQLTQPEASQKPPGLARLVLT